MDYKSYLQAEGIRGDLIPKIELFRAEYEVSDYFGRVVASPEFFVFWDTGFGECLIRIAPGP